MSTMQEIEERRCWSQGCDEIPHCEVALRYGQDVNVEFKEACRVRESTFRSLVDVRIFWQLLPSWPFAGQILEAAGIDL